MGWRFRKSFSPIPGVRLTLSPSGISTSVGVGPLRVSSGPRGAALTATLPGTGLSFRQPLTGGNSIGISGLTNGRTVPAPAPPLPHAVSPLQLPPLPAGPTGPAMHPIQSVGSGILTSSGLSGFKEVLEQAQSQHASVQRDLDRARAQEAKDVGKYRSWASGWLLRRLMRKRFALLQETSETATAQRQELDEQLALSKLQTQFEMPERIAQAFARLSDDFSALSRSQRIWDNVAHRAANQFAERTTAGRIVDLKPVRYALGKCGVIETRMPVPHLQNANGGDIFLYPGFMVYLASETNYALIEYSDITLAVVPMRFHEEQAVPTDAAQVGTTWAKSNKDGSPDRRFNDNYQIPVMQYARLTLQTARGLNEEYLISNVSASEAFARAWNDLVAAVRAGR